MTGSVDLSAARYRIDRTEGTLTVTYPVRRILARGSDYTQFFASIATVDKAQDDAVASAVFITSLRHPAGSGGRHRRRRRRLHRPVRGRLGR